MINEKPKIKIKINANIESILPVEMLKEVMTEKSCSFLMTIRNLALSD